MLYSYPKILGGVVYSTLIPIEYLVDFKQDLGV